MDAEVCRGEEHNVETHFNMVQNMHVCVCHTHAHTRLLRYTLLALNSTASMSRLGLLILSPLPPGLLLVRQ